MVPLMPSLAASTIDVLMAWISASLAVLGELLGDRVAHRLVLMLPATKPAISTRRGLQRADDQRFEDGICDRGFLRLLDLFLDGANGERLLLPRCGSKRWLPCS